MTSTGSKSVGFAYGSVTFVLVAALLTSGWCWGAQSGPGANNTLHDACLFIWVASGMLLALSQIIFIVVALRIKDNSSAADLTSGTPTREARVSVPKVVILVFGGGILAAMALLVWALANMPS